MNILLPKPPNKCLPIVTAINPPSIGIHHGTTGDNVNPKSVPAKNELPSPNIDLCLTKSFSKITALNALDKTKYNTYVPKKYVPIIIAGINAITTFHILVSIVSLL